MWPFCGFELQLAVHLPGDVRELQHRDGDVADSIGCVELLAGANGGDEVGEVQIGHVVGAGEVGGRGSLPFLDLAGLLAVQVIDLVAGADRGRRCRWFRR